MQISSRSLVESRIGVLVMFSALQRKFIRESMAAEVPRDA